MQFDCDKCKRFEECYNSGKKAKTMREAIVLYFSSLRQRDYCVHNDKRMWEGKEE